jgi:CheY-like chemotaxis protein
MQDGCYTTFKQTKSPIKVSLMKPVQPIRSQLSVGSPRREVPLDPAADAYVTLPAEPLARILISDDDAAIRRIYTTILPAHGLSVIEVPGGDGWATLELAQRTRPALVLSDLNKPGLDGVQIRHYVRNDPQTKQIPYLLISAIDAPTSPATPLDDTLPKPFTIAELLYRITTLLGLSSAEHTRLAMYALNQTMFAVHHPAMGLPSVHSVAATLPLVMSRPDWTAASVNISDFAHQVRLRGRASADALLARFAYELRRITPATCVLGHSGFDSHLVLVGPSADVAYTLRRFAERWASVSALAVRLAPRLPLPHLRVRQMPPQSADTPCDLVALRHLLS